MDLSRLRELCSRWRDEAEGFRRRGLEREAAMAESFATDLDEALRAWLTEPLSIEEAADEMGCAYDAMAKRLRRGTVPNTGRPGAPRIRRCDLHGDGGPREERSVSDVLDRVLGS